MEMAGERILDIKDQLSYKQWEESIFQDLVNLYGVSAEDARSFIEDPENQTRFKEAYDRL